MKTEPVDYANLTRFIASASDRSWRIYLYARRWPHGAVRETEVRL